MTKHSRLQSKHAAYARKCSIEILFVTEPRECSKMSMIETHDRQACDVCSHSIHWASYLNVHRDDGARMAQETQLFMLASYHTAMKSKNVQREPKIDSNLDAL
jgi:hypothetical protein